MQTASFPFNVIRHAEGATIFVLASSTGAEWIFHFRNGAWSTDSTNPVQPSKRTDLWSLSLPDEAYEVPDVVLFGG